MSHSEETKQGCSHYKTVGEGQAESWPTGAKLTKLYWSMRDTWLTVIYYLFCHNGPTFFKMVI